MNFGAAEFLFIAILALIIFGPRRLPDIARTVGRAMREVRNSARELTDEFREGFEEPPGPRHEPPRPGPR
jgi:Tat protein translocase TatB subunit